MAIDIIFTAMSSYDDPKKAQEGKEIVKHRNFLDFGRSPGVSWTHLGRSWGRLGGLWIRLGSSWRGLGGSRRRLEGVLEALEVVLEATLGQDSFGKRKH